MAIQKWLTFKNQFWKNTKIKATQIPDVFVKDYRYLLNIQGPSGEEGIAGLKGEPGQQVLPFKLRCLIYLNIMH